MPASSLCTNRKFFLLCRPPHSRKNSLFFGNEKAARRLMVLYSIAMCERHDVNPQAYLTDILLRIQDQPKSRLAELLPHRWKQTFGAGFTVERTVTPNGAT